jgi:hypothetical protein
VFLSLSDIKVEINENILNTSKTESFHVQASQPSRGQLWIAALIPLDSSPNVNNYILLNLFIFTLYSISVLI